MRFIQKILALCLLIITGQNYRAFTENHIGWHGMFVSYIDLPVFLLLWLGYKWVHKIKVVNFRECDFEYGA